MGRPKRHNENDIRQPHYPDGPRSLLRIVSALLLLASCTEALPVSAGVQSGPSGGNTFAGAALFHGNEQSLFIAGMTYAETPFDPHDRNDNTINQGARLNGHCYMTQVWWDDEDWDLREELRFDASTVYEHVNEQLSRLSTCQAMDLQHPNQIWLVGNNEAAAFGYSSSNNGRMSAMLHMLNAKDASQPAMQSEILSNEESTSNTQLEYPQAILTKPNSNTFWILTLGAEDWEENTRLGQQPNFLSKPKYGSAFHMNLHRYSWDQPMSMGIPTGPAIIAKTWQQTYPIVTFQDEDSQLSVAGMLRLKQVSGLVVAGTIRGQGKAFGGTDYVNAVNGFLTLLDEEQGQVVRAQRISGTSQDEALSSSDSIMGMCADPNSEDNTFYIVGSTDGVWTGISQLGADLQPPMKSRSAFVSKVAWDNKAQRFQVVWSWQWGARVPDQPTQATNTRAVACAVRNNIFYVAGEVDAGAGVVADPSTHLVSQGNGDIWVTRLSTNEGTLHWMRQLGSPAEERLASHGAVTVDLEGNVVVVGETNGSFFREKTDTNTDIFVLTLQKESGEIPPQATPVKTPETLSAPVVAPTAAPVKEQTTVVPERITVPPAPDTATELPRPQTPHKPLPPPPSKPQTETPSKPIEESSIGTSKTLFTHTAKMEKTTIAVSALTGLMIMSLLLIYCCNRRGHRSTEKGTERRKVFLYLHDFDVDQVDVRASATGGWHGTYTGTLAKGEGERSMNHPINVRALGSASAISDSLFMEAETNYPYSRKYRFGEDSKDEDDDFDEMERLERTLMNDDSNMRTII